MSEEFKEKQTTNTSKQGTMKATSYCVSSLACLILLFVLAPFLTTTFADKESSYVVYMGAHPKDIISLTGDDRDAQVMSYHIEFLGSFLEGGHKAKDKIFYSYSKHINGFAATLTEEVASQLSYDPNVVSVFLDQGIQRQTTRSWDFLGLQDNGKNSDDVTLWEKAKFGENIIIGNIDTGVWPESTSFSDEGMGEIPGKWKGTCQKDINKSFPCNRKLIGARYFNKGLISSEGLLDSSFYTPRDMEGHGSHTLSTAGGSIVVGANIFGFGNGTARGGASSARVASYKACWPGFDCKEADVLAAFDMAIHDGVDVLSISLLGSGPFYEDTMAIGSYHAVRHGIVVAACAGNGGPNFGSLGNLAPWIITVGANTMDRQFPSYIIFGNETQIKGESLSDKSLCPNTQYPIISAMNAKAANATAEDAELCLPETLDSNRVKGKILVCVKGIIARVDKGRQAAIAGAVGMVLVNTEEFGNELRADPHVLPATHISYKGGVALLSYINSTSSPVAKLTKPTTKLGTKPAPVMAAFSSVGPNTMNPEILKPDITAPGVNIIAAYTEAQAPTGQFFDKRRVKFNVQGGTSMSSPHIAGVAGLLKSMHPEWSPSAIKSAIMTTASTLDTTFNPINDAFYGKATPLHFGAGHVQPNLAMDPGLVYDLGTNDYLNFLCAIGYNQTQIQLVSGQSHTCPKSITLNNFNYPAISVPNLIGTSTVTLTRKVKNVGPLPRVTYKLAPIKNPPGISVKIKPNTLKFESIGDEKVFSIYIQANKHVAAKEIESHAFHCDR